MKNVLKITLIAILFPLLSFHSKKQMDIESNSLNDKKIIVIDAGHGGTDGGVTVDEIKEKEIAFTITKKVQFMNKDKNYVFVLLREEDEFLSLEDRISRLKELKPDLLISLHLNMDKDSTKNGAEIYIGKKNPFLEKSKSIAQSVLATFPENILQREVIESNMYILNNADCPAILIEMGYLTNAKDKEYLTSVTGQTELAETIVKNLKKY